VKIIAFILFGLISITASAQQFAFELWHEGKLILDSGDTLKGKIKYDLQSDLIQYQTNEQPPKLDLTQRLVNIKHLSFLNCWKRVN
jgi:hypothetical protein